MLPSHRCSEDACSPRGSAVITCAVHHAETAWRDANGRPQGLPELAVARVAMLWGHAGGATKRNDAGTLVTGGAR